MFRGRSKMLKTIGVIGLFTSMGIISNTIGPTLVDLKYLFGTNYESVSLGAALRGFGIVPGSIIAGYIETKYPAKKETLTTIVFVISVACFFASSFARYLAFFWILWTVIGICIGFFFAVSGHIVKELWGERFSLVWSLTGFGNSVGGFVTPLIVNPFLMKQLPTSDLNSTALLNVSTLSVEGTHTTVQISYIVLGSTSLVMSLPWFIAYILDMSITKESESLIRSAENGTVSAEIANPPTRFKSNLLIGLLTMYSFCTFGSFFILLTFIRTFSFDHFQLDKGTASYINATFMVGCIVSCVLIVCVLLLFSIRTVFFFGAALQLLSMTVWMLFTRSNLVWHWIFSGLLGVTNRLSLQTVPMYFNSMAENGLFMTFFVCARGISDLFFVWLAGRLYMTEGPDVIYVITVVTAALAGVFAAFVFVNSRLLNKGPT